MLYQSKLGTRFIARWGILGAALSLAALFTISDQIIPFSTVFILLNLPKGLHEMFLAVWLMVKGVNPSATASGPAKTAMNVLLSAAYIGYIGEGGSSASLSPLSYNLMLGE
jgi:hypothetical protein